MSRESQRQIIKFQRVKLIQEIEEIYLNAFERIVGIGLKEADIAKLSSIFLQSKEGAIKPLEQEIERPLITKPPKKQNYP